MDFFVNGVHKGQEYSSMNLELINMEHVNIGQYHDGTTLHASSAYYGNMEFRDRALSVNDVAQMYLRDRYCLW